MTPRYNYQIKSPNELKNLLNNFEGSIAMVKTGKNNSSSTEFFATNQFPERWKIFNFWENY